jgi:AraC-like DNA-binding protein
MVSQLHAIIRVERDLAGDATHLQRHSHEKAQLLYVISGVLTVESASGIWTVPPQCALWIPGGIAHSGRIAGPIKVSNLYIDSNLTTGLNNRCAVLFVQPLLRELLLRFSPVWAPVYNDKDREGRLISFLMDELAAAPIEPIDLPTPRDRRLRRVTDSLVAQPSVRFTISEWGARVGASGRTLTRLFQRETGMSFIRWRQQLHVGIALQRLAGGEPVTNIAGDLGYESLSAFIVMFRRILGTTPTHYFDQHDFAGSHTEKIRKTRPVNGRCRNVSAASANSTLSGT